MNDRPRSVSVNLALIGLNALLWLAFGVLVAAHAHPALPDQPLYRGIMALLSFGAAGILAGLTVLLAKRSRPAWVCALAFFMAAAAATVFDNFGPADLVFVVVCLIPTLLLIKDRGWYLQGGRPHAGKASEGIRTS